MRINLRIPSPFMRQKLLAQAEDEPEIDPLDVDIPFGVHPLIDFVRVSLFLMRQQAEICELFEEMRGRVRRLRRWLAAVCFASAIATVCQVLQLWVNWQ